VALTAEFTVEPFHPGAPGPHVLAAIEAARRAGATVDVGPFANVLGAADDATVLSALDAAVRAAVAAGATAVRVQIEASGSPT
jgi:uncharacterized protein YqgV (UPF0045/DUF77 family)